MPEAKDSRFFLQRVNYKELTSSATAAAITAVPLPLIEQSSRVDAPFESKVLVIFLYMVLATGMTHMGLIHTNRALRNV